MPHLITNCMVVGGIGKVGHQFAGLLATSGIRITVVDIDQSVKVGDAPSPFMQGDITAPTDPLQQLVAQADCVILAVPEQAALAAVPKLLALMAPGSLLVDTLSVKSRIAALLQENPRSIEAVSLNPMFAPSLGMAGRPVAVITLADGPRAASFLKLLASWGAKLVHLEAADHDRLVASVQAASHLSILAFGLALKDLGADVRKLCSLATPPHLTLLALLARVTSGEPEVYWDIQAGNPDAPAARTALRKGIERITTTIEGNDPAEFAALFEEMRIYLQDERGDLSKLCTQIFENLPPMLHSPASE